jgi:hypothetical protein
MDEKIKLLSLIISVILVYFKFLLLFLQLKENFIIKYLFKLNSFTFVLRIQRPQDHLNN